MSIITQITMFSDSPKIDGTVEVLFMEYDNSYLKAFTAYRVRSASGAKYKSKDNRFVFWSKGNSASIFNEKDDIIYQGEKHRDNPKAACFSGKLIFAHALHTFQKCGEKEIVWISDPNHLLKNQYESLIKSKAPYKAVYVEFMGVIKTVANSVDNIDGFVADFDKILTVTKLNTMKLLKKYPSCHTKQGIETIYFSQISKKWRDNIGVCNTCTPENGFSTDGVVDNIAWRELRLSLKNDLGENPSSKEVKTFFTSQYAEKSGHYYPVHVSFLKGIFTINIPVEKTLKDIDFFDRRGALLATYDVIKYE